MALFLAFVAVLLAAFALVRIRELAQRIRALHEELLDQRLGRGWPPPEPVDPPPTPKAAPTTAAPAAPTAPPPPPPPRIRSPLPPLPPTDTIHPQPAPSPAARRVESIDPRIDWERWLGVRGAAVLGGIFLAIAGVLFFQYSIEHGIITKEMRVALGALAGVACFVVGEVVRRRGYALTANAITGAGAVILYAAFWSAHVLGIFAFGVSFAAMVATTALCCFLSWRNASQLVAWLGLSGGFATPILLSTGRDEPIALFSYLMLLDVSFLFVARKRRWPLVGALGLVGTVLIQAAWSTRYMGPTRFVVGVVFLGVFAMLFALLAPAANEGDEKSGERGRWLAVRVGALLFPFAFAAQYAGRVDVGYHLYPLVLLASLLAAAASILARRQDAPYVPVGAAAGASAIALVWVLSNRLETARVWELVACAVFSCAVLHVFSERKRGTSPATKAHDLASGVAAGGMIAVLFAAAYPSKGADLWPLVAGFTLVPLFLLRLDALAPSTLRPFLACVPAGIGISVWMNASASSRTGVPIDVVRWFAAVAVAPAVFLLAARARKHVGGRRSTFAAAAIACVPLFSSLEIRFGHGTHPAVAFVPILALGALAACGAAGARNGLLLGFAAIATSFVQWVVETNIRPVDPTSAWIGFAVLVVSAALFLSFPLARRSIWSQSRTIAWIPLVVLWWFPALVEMRGAAGRGNLHAIPALAVALVYLAGAAWALRDRRAEIAAERSRDRSTIATLGIRALALAAPFLAIALAGSLGRSPWAPAAAGLCLGCALLWKLADDPPLKYAALGGAGFSFLILLGEALEGPLQAFPFPLVSGLGFDFFLPAAAVVAAGWIGHAQEVARVREAEKGFYASELPVLFALSGVAGIGSLLVWITVEVERVFAREPTFHVRFGDHPARDLSLSIAWALFALLLLLFGTSRKLGALRWVSLFLLLVTIGKVFLLDLEDLAGLYRVGSFLGLAVSLLVVSLLYQRFVFRKPRPEAP
jgi:uncharacterized membrane protein